MDTNPESTAADGDVLLVERHDDVGVAVFIINRPDSLNALTTSWWRRFAVEVEAFNQDDSMHVGILTGTGRAFCAGRDLKELAAHSPDPEDPEAVPGPYHRRLCSSSPKPFISAVNGIAAGGGVERALDCDIRIAVPDAVFSLPEPRWGLVASTAVQMLPATVGLGNALFLLLSGEAIDAPTALRMGLVQEIVSPERLMVRALELAAAMRLAESGALRLTKGAARASSRAAETAALERLAAAPDQDARRLAAEGARAFATGSSAGWRL